MSLDQEFITNVQQLYRSFAAHDAQQTERLKRYRNIEPESAQFIAMLIQIQQSKRILEIGTSTGYSTLWMAKAAAMHQGHISSLEIDPKRTAQAKQHAERFGLTEYIEFWTGDAKDFIAQAQAPYDLILLDAERDAYLEYWPHLQALIRPQGGVLIVDNVISHAQEVKSFLALLRTTPGYLSTTLALGAGLFLLNTQN
ncbi:O-methyltransferase [Acinetobacter larvae]|uniref:Methyltransferase n=1 Tax=Acinetobacter larvae TaxID=1789224 RepID=A0A1B2M0P6_9GAMM|nr:class I SAM-dependent methyltransferase [Acinetobacter larvae]AOA58760.1 methyltransferase [Acinetobacter larvae]